MREIKFRGKNVDSGEWVFGWLAAHDAINVEIYDYYGRLLSIADYEVIPKTVGQFTGLKDKNGADIYDGDILQGKFHSANVMEVVLWDSEQCCFKTQYNYIEPQQLNEFSIIGNIHD